VSTAHAADVAWTSQGRRGGATLTLTIVREDGKEIKLVLGLAEARELHRQAETSLQAYEPEDV
jgi:hypothetical protein